MTPNQKTLYDILVRAEQAFSRELLASDFSHTQATANLLSTAAVAFAVTHNRKLDLETSLGQVLNIFRSVYETINEAKNPLPDSTMLGAIMKLRAEDEAKH